MRKRRIAMGIWGKLVGWMSSWTIIFQYGVLVPGIGGFGD